nr:hypothetical protein CFP56_70025 [Quercus suber]
MIRPLQRNQATLDMVHVRHAHVCAPWRQRGRGVLYVLACALVRWRTDVCGRIEASSGPQLSTSAVEASRGRCQLIGFAAHRGGFILSESSTTDSEGFGVGGRPTHAPLSSGSAGAVVALCCITLRLSPSCDDCALRVETTVDLSPSNPSPHAYLAIPARHCCADHCKSDYAGEHPGDPARRIVRFDQGSSRAMLIPRNNYQADR